MNKLLHILFLCMGVLLLGALPIMGQTTTDDQALIDFYTDIPHYRGNDGAFTLGDVDVPIKIIVFADFLCPHCQDYHDVIAEFIETFVVTGQAQLEYRFFPVIDQNASPYLAVLNECADGQDKFWATYDVIYELAKSRQIDGTIVEKVATRLDMDLNALNTCISGMGPFQYQIDTIHGRDLSVSGTPAVRVQVGDSPVGVLKLGEIEFARGGIDLETLTEFINSPDPSANVDLINRILVDNLLVDESLISDDENCQLPCWRGIVAGETTLTTAQEILETDTTLDNVSFQESGARSGVIFSQEGQDRICCQVVSDGTGNVDYISLQFTATVTLGQVLERYGEPAFVEAQLVTRDQALFTLFYPDVPIILYAFAGLPSDALSDESLIVGLALPSAEIMLLFTSSDELPVWTGFVSYDAWLAELDG